MDDAGFDPAELGRAPLGLGRGDRGAVNGAASMAAVPTDDARRVTRGAPRARLAVTGRG